MNSFKILKEFKLFNSYNVLHNYAHDRQDHNYAHDRQDHNYAHDRQDHKAKFSS